MKRTEIRRTVLTADEAEHIAAMSAATGHTASSYIRLLIHDEMRAEGIDPAPRRLYKPSVTRLKIKSATRADVWKASGGVCFYCHASIEGTHWQIDHKTPLSRGGDDHISNLVAACPTCNRQKGASSAEDLA